MSQNTIEALSLLDPNEPFGAANVQEIPFSVAVVDNEIIITGSKGTETNLGEYQPDSGVELSAVTLDGQGRLVADYSDASEVTYGTLSAPGESVTFTGRGAATGATSNSINFKPVVFEPSIYDVTETATQIQVGVNLDGLPSGDSLNYRKYAAFSSVLDLAVRYQLDISSTTHHRILLNRTLTNNLDLEFRQPGFKLKAGTYYVKGWARVTGLAAVGSNLNLAICPSNQARTPLIWGTAARLMSGGTVDPVTTLDSYLTIDTDMWVCMSVVVSNQGTMNPTRSPANLTTATLGINNTTAEYAKLEIWQISQASEPMGTVDPLWNNVAALLDVVPQSLCLVDAAEAGNTAWWSVSTLPAAASGGVWGGPVIDIATTQDYIFSYAGNNPFTQTNVDTTIDFWIKGESAVGGGHILGSRSNVVNNSWLLFYNVNGGISLNVRLDSNQNPNAILATGSFPLNEWIHVAYERIGTVHRIYLNGALAAIGTYALPVGETISDTIGFVTHNNYTANPGYKLENIRVTKGQVRYNFNNYLVPTQRFSKYYSGEGLALPTSPYVNLLKQQYAANAVTTKNTLPTVSYNTYGLTYVSGGFLDGVALPDGRVFFAPLNNTDGVLIIDTVNQTATFETYGLNWVGSNKHNGAVLALNGKIYCSPATTVGEWLIIDPTTNTAVKSLLGLPANTAAQTGLCVHPTNGKIYASKTGGGIIVVDTLTDTATLEHVGTVVALHTAITDEGNVVFFAYQANKIAWLYDVQNSTVVETTTNGWVGTLADLDKSASGTLTLDGRVCVPASISSVSAIPHAFDSQSNRMVNIRQVTINKVFAVTNGPDGKVYTAPSTGATGIYMYDPVTMEYTLLSGTSVTANTVGRMLPAVDNKIYGAPRSALGVAVITFPAGVTAPVEMIGNPWAGK